MLSVESSKYNMGGTMAVSIPKQEYQEREITPEIAFYLPQHAKNIRLLKCVIVGGGQRGQCYSQYAKDFPHLTKKEDCIDITKECTENKIMLAVCHVLRYYPPNKKIKELITSGAIGDVVNIQHLEPVGFWHFAHSFVRGNGRNTEDSSFSLLVKSCHDIDLLVYYLSRNPRVQGNVKSGSNHCTSISSFGSLNHFKVENKPKGAGTRCLECDVEETCPYSALKIYINPTQCGRWHWPTSMVCDIEDVAELTDQLRHGPYGRCVYDCDNDVCDNQVVNLQFSEGQTVSFSMVAFTKSISARETKVFGTKGEITYDGGNQVRYYEFLTEQTHTYNCSSELAYITDMYGHDGADFYLMDAFVKAVMYDDPSYIATGPEETLRSHLLVFAAEESRLNGKTLKVNPDGSYPSAVSHS